MGIFRAPILHLAMLALLFSGLLYIFMVFDVGWSPASLVPLGTFFPACPELRNYSVGLMVPATPHEAPPRDQLAVVLRKASMANKTVIIAIVNKAYADPANSVGTDQTMLDLFLESFWLGKGTKKLFDHVVIVAMDRTAHMMCRFRRLNCYRLETEGVDFAGEKLYMSEDFIKMMWSRTKFLADVLRRGYSFIFTDTDVMWLRNPFNRLSNDETEDLQISTDSFNGDPWSESNYINTGFYFVRSNNRTVSLLDKWYSSKDNSTGMKEQDVLSDMMRSGVFSDLRLRVRFLDTVYFSGFCADRKDFGLVVTVHANCCRSIVAKISDLAVVLRDWKRYRFTNRHSDRNMTDRRMFMWSEHDECIKSWT